MLFELPSVFPSISLSLRLCFGCGEGGGNREKPVVFDVILFDRFPPSFPADSPVEDAGIGEGVGVGETEGGGETEGEGGRSSGEQEIADLEEGRSLEVEWRSLEVEGRSLGVMGRTLEFADGGRYVVR